MNSVSIFDVERRLRNETLSNLRPFAKSVSFWFSAEDMMGSWSLEGLGQIGVLSGTEKGLIPWDFELVSILFHAE